MADIIGRIAESVDNSVDIPVNTVDTPVGTVDTVVDTSVDTVDTPVNTVDTRRAYQRDWQRRKRAERKAAT